MTGIDNHGGNWRGPIRLHNAYSGTGMGMEGRDGRLLLGHCGTLFLPSPCLLEKRQIGFAFPLVWEFVIEILFPSGFGTVLVSDKTTFLDSFWHSLRHRLLR